MTAARALQDSPLNGRLWSRSAALALALHVAALAAVLVTLRGEIDDDFSGAPAIEISMEPMAPRDADAPDAPPGPASEAAAASTSSMASAETKEVKEEQITRSESSDGDVARAEKAEKPVKDERQHQSQQVMSQESAASEAVAPPKSEAQKQADKPAAPNQGADAARTAAILTWQKSLMAHLNRAKRYPAAGGKRSAEVSVYFTLDRRGHVTSAQVKKSAGEAMFDEAALAMMKRADPVPPPPAALADETLSFEVPVQFRAPKR